MDALFFSKNLLNDRTLRGDLGEERGDLGEDGRDLPVSLNILFVFFFGKCNDFNLDRASFLGYWYFSLSQISSVKLFLLFAFPSDIISFV